MISTFILDDEPLALELLEDDLKRIPDIKLVGRSSNPIVALQHIQNLKPDLLITDIQMPGLTGIESIKLLVHKPLVIFLTAYPNYALQSYDLDVVDYLLKPVKFDRLMAAILKVQTRLLPLAMPISAPVVPEPAPAKTNPSNAPFIFVKADYQEQKVVLDQVQYIEAMKDYIKIFITGRQHPLLTQMNLKTIEELLHPDQFIRIHRSYIVNVAYVDSVKRSQIRLGQNWLPVGEQYKLIVLSKLGIQQTSQLG